jgi:hypothetical protein
MKYFIALFLLTGCVQVGPDQFQAYQRQQKADERQEVRIQDSKDQAEWTRQVAIMMNPVQSARSVKKYPLVENILKRCDSESAKEYGPTDEVCLEAQKQLEKVRASGPSQQPSFVINAPGATFYGNNFYSPGATANGNINPIKKVSRRRQIPQSNLQTFWNGVFGFLNKGLSMAPWAAVSYIAKAAIEQPNTYIADSPVNGGDNNTGRLDYSYELNEVTE